MNKLYPLFGIIAALSYVLAVIIGGFLLQGYSHMYNSISELTASNVPKKPVIFIFLAIYNLCLALFGIGLYKNLSITPTVLVKLAAIMIVFVGILGAAMLYYVQDPRSTAMTFNGKIHLILAGLSSLLTMLIIIFLALGLKNGIVFKNFSLYSFISFGILFISGGIAAVSVANNAAYGGLFERITIGTFIQWIFVLALNLF